MTFSCIFFLLDDRVGFHVSSNWMLAAKGKTGAAILGERNYRLAAIMDADEQKRIAPADSQPDVRTDSDVGADQKVEQVNDAENQNQLKGQEEEQKGTAPADEPSSEKSPLPHAEEVKIGDREGTDAASLGDRKLDEKQPEQNELGAKGDLGTEANQEDNPELAGLSKNAMKRKRKQAQLLEQKSRRRAQERERRQLDVERRRKERQEKFSTMEPEEREKFMEERHQRMLEIRREERKVIEDTRRRILESKQRVCVDLEWHEHLTEREQHSLYKQLNYTYSAVRKAVSERRQGVQLIFSGVRGPMEKEMEKKVNGCRSWPVIWTEKNLIDYFEAEKESLVYLTHESSNVLKEIDPTKVYIVGGIVDRNRIKGATCGKARSLGLKTARLDLCEDTLKFSSGTTVLTVNHVVEILVEASNGLSWSDAVTKVLPGRKGVVHKANSPKMSEEATAD